MLCDGDSGDMLSMTMKLKDQVERARLAGLPRFTCEYVCLTCHTFERYASGVCIQCNRDRVKRASVNRSVKPKTKRDPAALIAHRAFNLAINRG